MVAVVSIPTRLRVVKEIQLGLGVDDHQDGCSRAAILKATSGTSAATIPGTRPRSGKHTARPPQT